MYTNIGWTPHAITIFIRIDTPPCQYTVAPPCHQLLKKVWNITFALIFCTYFFIIFTWVFHILKHCSFPYILQKKLHENRSCESRITASQTLWGSKSKLAETLFLGS